MKLVPEDAVYDPARGELSSNQRSVSAKVFELFQEIRRQKGLADADSPGKLTANEIIMAALEHVPGAGASVVSLLEDEVSEEKDFSNIANDLKNQLFD